MARKTPNKWKPEVVAFKVEAELAEFLNKLPNKSAFIRKAIAAQMSIACPLCNGAGTVNRAVHDHFAPLLREHAQRMQLRWLRQRVAAAARAGDLSPEDRHRLEQFFHGGPFYCDPCYEKAPTCGDCGWHIAADRVAEHQRQAHTN